MENVAIWKVLEISFHAKTFQIATFSIGILNAYV